MRSIKAPIPEIETACQNLSLAVDAHLGGRREEADALFRAADSSDVWAWLNPGWSRADLNVRVKAPPNDTRPVALALRDPIRHPGPALRAEVLARDGHRCRYCGIPVVSAEIRKIAHHLYPEAVPWGRSDPAQQHAGFQVLWLQYDHVVPYSHGGRSDAANIVICCALCNFGKDRFTLKQLGIEDPRLYPSIPTDWDGLERLRIAGAGPPRLQRAQAVRMVSGQNMRSVPRESYFLPRATISKGYVLAPAIQGKDRWFVLNERIEAEPVTLDGVQGVRLTCERRLIIQRGIDPDVLSCSVPASGESGLG